MERDRFEEAIRVIEFLRSDYEAIVAASPHGTRHWLRSRIDSLDLAIEALREKQQREKEPANDEG